jgi:aryl-alcohol dehydrogenase-like predicted oxidoreductase
MELRGVGHTDGRPVDPAEAVGLLNLVLDSGINFIDTSPDYGTSEEMIGRAIGHRRDEYVLATKCGCPIDVPPDTPRPLPHDFGREHVRSVLEHSLRMMGTDHVDLLQFHHSPAMEKLNAVDAIETLQQLKDEGKIRFIGASSNLPNLPEQIETGLFDAFQIPYSALQTEHEDLIFEAASKGAGIVIRGGAAQGKPEETVGDRWRPATSASGWALAEKANLQELADGLTLTQFMLRLTLSNPSVTTAIVGTLKPEHLRQNVAAASLGVLAPNVYTEARRRLADAIAE